MVRVTELAFGLEKLWLRRERDAKCVPWHACLAAMILGILAGDGAGIAMGLAGNVLFAGLTGLAAAVLVMFRRRFSGDRWRLGRVAAWCLCWMMLWGLLGFWMGSPRTRVLMPENVVCRVSGVIEATAPGTRQVLVEVGAWTCGERAGTGKLRLRMDVGDGELRAGNLASGLHFEVNGVFSRYEAADVPGMFDSVSWAHSHEIDGRLKKMENLVVQTSGATLRGRLELNRREAFERLAEVSPKGILPALVLGTTRDIDSGTRETFGHLGIAHVLAVSGLHFGLIAMMINAVLRWIFGRIPWVMRRFGKNRAASVGAIPVLLVYLCFVGAPMSAQRALIMAAICVCARLLASRADRVRALCAAGLVILSLEPMAVFQISFQLSFSAVLGIIWSMDVYDREIHMKIVEKVWGKRKEKIVCSCVEMLMMTLSTSLTTAPFVIWHFGQLPVVGILTNLVVIPYVSFVLMPLAMVAALFAVTGIPGARWVFWIAGGAETVLTEFAAWFDEHVVLSFVEMPQHPVPCILAALTAIALLWRFKANRGRGIAACMMVLCMTICIVMCQIDSRWLTRPSDLRMSFVAMGQADATLIEFPDGRVMLVDAGLEVGREENAVQTRLMPYLKRLGIRHIDTVVVTHGDYDHAAGLAALMQRCSIGEIWTNGANGMDGTEWMKGSQGVPVVGVQGLPKVQKLGGADVTILWPVADSQEILEDRNALTANEMSVVLRIEYGAFSAVLAGDAGAPVEEYLMESGAAVKTDVLKAGHHGSRSASSERWIESLRPQIVVFSAGKYNRYRFPHREVQMRMLRASSRMYQTGDRGTVRIASNGKSLRVDSMR